MRYFLPVSLFALASTVRGQSSSSTVPTTTTPATATSAAAASGDPNVQTATSLLPVPTYASVAPYSSATASALAVSLPPYTYNLTSESLATRTGICNQTTAFCTSSRCTIAAANVTTNFCNPTTMGWNCECNDNAQSRLQPIIVPVNSYDCRLRTLSCLNACQQKNSTPPITSIAACQNACNYIIGSTCGTAAQVVPEYQVSSYDDKPKYYPDTSKGGVALGITTSVSGAARAVVRSMPVLVVVAGIVCGGVLIL